MSIRENFDQNFRALKIYKMDKSGPSYKDDDVIDLCIKMIITDCYFRKTASNMSKDIENAIEKTDKVTNEFSKSLDRLKYIESNFVEQSKKAASSVKDASEKIAQGIIRIEKQANFDKLERYVLLIERAAEGMERLAELEKSGKLEKIIDALK
jgi:hypothetical protein